MATTATNQPQRQEEAAQTVNFHIDHPEDNAHTPEHSNNNDGRSTQTTANNSISVSNDRTIGRDLNAPHREPTKSPNGSTTKEDIEMSSRPLGGVAVPAGQAFPGYANDAVYGSAYNRAKVEGGVSGGYYDEKKHQYHEELPKAGFGDRFLRGVTRPTNLTAGERPKDGVTSTGVDNWDRMTYEKVASLPDQGHVWWPYILNLPAFAYPWNVNANSYRLGMIPVLAICLMGTDQRHHRWMYYVTLGLCVDYVCRMLFGPRGSLCTLFGEWIDTGLSYIKTSGSPKGLFPRSMVAGAPYQFSDFVGACILAAATISFFDSNDDDGDTAGAVILAFMCLVAFVELVFGLPIFVWFFNQMIHFKWIWKDSEIKSAMMRDEAQRLQLSEDIRMTQAATELADPSHAAAPQHLNFAGKGKRSLPYTYRTSNEYHKRHDWNPVKNAKVTNFLAPTTLAALAWSWEVAFQPQVFDTPGIIWYVLVIAAVACWGFCALIYSFKTMFYPRYVMWEMEHPIYRYYFLAMPLNWIMFIPLIQAAHLPTLAEVVFWIGAPALLAYSIWQLALLFHQQAFFEIFNATILMIPMSNAIAAYMLPLVHSNYTEAAWLWLGISVFMWVIFSTIVFFKHMHSIRSPDAYRYSLWMLMGTAMAITIALTSIYSPVGVDSVTTNTNTGSSHTPISTGDVNSAPVSGGKSYDVSTGSGGNDLILPNAQGSPNNVIEFYSNNIAYNLVPAAGQRINALASGSAFLVPANDFGATCTSKSDLSGFDCNARTQAASSGSTTNFFVQPWNPATLAAFYIGLVLFLMLLLMSLMGYFGRTTFRSQWWVVALCMCFLTIACLQYHAAWKSPTTEGIAITAMVLTNILCALFFMNTIRQFIQGEIFRPDTLKLSPTEFYRLPNKAIREALYALQAHVTNPQASVEDWRVFETVLLPNYILTSFAMNFLKRGTLYPVMAAWFGPNICVPIDENAKALEVAITRINDRLLACQRLAVNSVERANEEVEVRKEFATYVSGVLSNLEEEDIHIYQLARRYISANEARTMIRKSWDEIPPIQWGTIIPFVVEFLRCDELRVRWIETLIGASPDHCQLVGKLLYENLDPFMYDRLVIDLPEVRPRMTPGYTRIW